MAFPKNNKLRKGRTPWNKGTKTSKEVILKMSLSRKGQVPWNKGLSVPESIKIKSSKTWFKKGQTPFNKGKSLSKETKAKIALVHVGNTYRLGKKHSEETKRKISSMLRGKVSNRKGSKHTEESKIKMRQSLKGRVPWNRGIKMPQLSGKNNPAKRPEVREKLRQSRLKQVIPFKDTSIEVKLQNLLKANNIEFSTHYSILGQPDIFIKPNIAIFADGCYWHKCPECGYNDLKIREKDRDITKRLQQRDYTVIRIWEHEINDSTVDLLSRIPVA